MPELGQKGRTPGFPSSLAGSHPGRPRSPGAWGRLDQQPGCEAQRGCAASSACSSRPCVRSPALLGAGGDLP